MDAKSSNLTGLEWRDANVDTLPQWHPDFAQFATQAQNVLDGFRSFSKDYKEHLLRESSDSPSELKEHVLQEVITYLANRMDEITDEIWGE